MQKMWKTMHAKGSQQIEKLLSCYQAKANLDESRRCQKSIGQIESFSMDRETIEKLSRKTPDNSMDQNCVKFCREKKKKGLDR